MSILQAFGGHSPARLKRLKWVRALESGSSGLKASASADYLCDVGRCAASLSTVRCLLYKIRIKILTMRRAVWGGNKIDKVICLNCLAQHFAAQSKCVILILVSYYYWYFWYHYFNSLKQESAAEDLCLGPGSAISSHSTPSLINGNTIMTVMSAVPKSWEAPKVTYVQMVNCHQIKGLPLRCTPRWKALKQKVMCLHLMHYEYISPHSIAQRKRKYTLFQKCWPVVNLTLWSCITM